MPSLLPFPGEGVRQASRSRDVASCRGKENWMRQSLEPSGSEKDDLTLVIVQKLCQSGIEGGRSLGSRMMGLPLKDIDGQIS